MDIFRIISCSLNFKISIACSLEEMSVHYLHQIMVMSSPIAKALFSTGKLTSIISWIMPLFYLNWWDSIIFGGTSTILWVAFHHFICPVVSVPMLFSLFSSLQSLLMWSESVSPVSSVHQVANLSFSASNVFILYLLLVGYFHCTFFLSWLVFSSRPLLAQ